MRNLHPEVNELILFKIFHRAADVLHVNVLFPLTLTLTLTLTQT